MIQNDMAFCACASSVAAEEDVMTYTSTIAIVLVRKQDQLLTLNLMTNQEPAIRSLSDLYEHLNTLQYAEKELLYRGHEDHQYKLLSTVGRAIAPRTSRLSVNKREKRLISEIKRYAVKDSYSTAIADDDIIEWAILGRHHGLPTRLIDFSTNPLVALYFACKEVNKEKGKNVDGCIWVMSGMRDESSARVTINPWSLQKSIKYRPKKIHGRILAQNAIMIIPKDAGECLTKEFPVVADVNSVRTTKGSKKLIKFLVPADCKSHLRKELERSGIDEARLFPGLSGIARAIAAKDYFFGA